MMFSSNKDGSNRTPNVYPIGWYGDSGLGEELIQKILSGRKTATLAAAYDPAKGKVGEIARLVDKTGRERALLRITNVEFLMWKDLSEAHAAKLDLTFEEIRSYFKRDLARDFRPEEEIRITSFEIVR